MPQAYVRVRSIRQVLDEAREDVVHTGQVHSKAMSAQLGRGRKASRIVTDFARLSVAYAADSGQRNRFRELLKREGATNTRPAVEAAEAAAAPDAALAYAGLSATSLVLAGIRVLPAARLPAQVNLLIGEITPGAVFAGVHTAVTVAKAMAESLGLTVRVVLLDFAGADNTVETVARYLANEFGLTPSEIIHREQISGHHFGERDVWLATHSKTAHAAEVACRAGVLSADRVVYLIQDYEPGFNPWSTESTVAAATYHAGFIPLVNSAPLATYLADTEGLRVPAGQVFSPSFDLARLRATAAARTPRDTVRVLFYGRPSKPRNLFALGVSALRAAVAQLGADAAAIEFVSAGEPHPDIELGEGVTLTSVGRLGWDDYFDLVSGTDVFLSLQASPHPSHPPFDAAISGAIAITNDFAGTRTSLHPRIVARAAETASLAAALVDAIRADHEPRGYLPLEPGVLGVELEAAVEAAVAHLPA